MCSRQRGGTTLVEVLVAIFIMAIGLMTLLTLFPLGALSMAQAIQDSRAGQAAANAAALAEAKQIRHDDKVLIDIDPNFPGDQRYPAPAQQRPLFIEPLPRGGQGVPNKKLPPISNLDGPSYPIFVDPIGYLATKDPIGGRQELGIIYPAGIPRRTTRYIFGPDANPYLAKVQTQWAYRFHSLLDDVQFDKDTGAGIPVGAPTTVERENRYTWAYMLRRPRASDASVVDESVILYNGRPALNPLPEHVYLPIVFNQGSTSLDIPYADLNVPKPDIKKGNWVLDATMRQPLTGNTFQPEPHGYFYRVVGVTDTVSTSGKPQVTLELQEPLKGLLHPPPNVTSFSGVLIFMENVVEVFEKGSGWKP